MVWLFFSTPLHAAVVQDNPGLLDQHRQEQEQRRQEIEERLKRPVPIIPIEVPIELPKLLPEGKCQTLKNVWLYGADHFAKNKQATLFKPYLGKCLYNADIHRLLNQTQDWYLNNGYITSRAKLKLPQTSLDLGNLEIYVIEGKIENLKLGKNTAFDQRRLDNAISIEKGEVLNIQQIDQGVEILNRSFAHIIQMKIKPSDIPAHSNIVLSERRNSSQSINGTRLGRHMGRQKLSYQQSNGGSESTGETLNVATFNRDNLFGINDDVQLSWTESYPNSKGSKESTNTATRYKSMHGPWSYTASFYDGFNIRTVDGTTTPFLSSGDTRNYTLDISRMGYRDARKKLEYKLTAKHSDKQNYINETLVEVSSRKVSNLDLTLNYSHFFNNGTLILNPTISSGMPWFDSITDADDITDEDPHAEYINYKLYASYQQTLARNTAYPLTLAVNINGQTTNTILYGENQFIIGGEYSIRGYKNNVLSGEKGWSIRNDLTLPIGSWFEPMKKRPYLSGISLKVFYDLGEVESLADKIPEKLSGNGWGLDYRYRWFNLSYTRAKALRQSDQFLEKEGEVMYYSASVNVTF